MKLNYEDWRSCGEEFPISIRIDIELAEKIKDTITQTITHIVKREEFGQLPDLVHIYEDLQRAIDRTKKIEAEDESED